VLSRRASLVGGIAMVGAACAIIIVLAVTGYEHTLRRAVSVAAVSSLTVLAVSAALLMLTRRRFGKKRRPRHVPVAASFPRVASVSGQGIGPADMLGQYQLLTCVGQGGMGRVWAARQVGSSIQRLVALKTGLDAEDQTPEFRRMFTNEARIASLIRHPNVCGVYELGESRGMLYQVMEWCDGASLRQVLDKLAGTRMSPAVAARIVAKVSAGLHAAHELEDDDGVRMHVVHRDVSPQNILISKSGQVKVTDFGVAKAKGQRHRGSATGELKGKISYVAPEQITSLEVDHRADIFALGCVLYEATVGVEPFRAEGSLSTPYQLLARDVATPQTLVHGYPEELASIVVKALARDPKDRFQTAEAFGVAIETWLARSHGIVTEQTIADLVTETVGTFVEEKSRRIEQAIAKITLPMTPDLNALRSLPVRSTGRGAAASAAPQRVAIVSETGTPPLMTSEPEGAARPTVPARPSARKPASR